MGKYDCPYFPCEQTGRERGGRAQGHRPGHRPLLTPEPSPGERPAQAEAGGQFTPRVAAQALGGKRSDEGWSGNTRSRGLKAETDRLSEEGQMVRGAASRPLWTLPHL